MSIGLKFLEEIRIKKCLKHCVGKVLDIGCGNNRLIKSHGRGIGVDVYKWAGIDVICDGAFLPFKDNTFDTVTFLASLNHIPKRLNALIEANRVLKRNSKIVITTPGTISGYIIHKIGGLLWDKDQKVRGMKDGEVFGLSEPYVQGLLENAEFDKIKKYPFEFGLNSLYIAYTKK